ncbi:MAG: murein biosynthesis integral membrane protein MurJ, partial [Candidatus Porifericomitaceae bacterium WSBS_2022_MAG_OTU9]
CLIGAALWLAPQMQVPLYALAIAVPLAGLAQLGMLLPWLARRKLLAWPAWNSDRQGAKQVLCIMLPAVFGVSVVQCNLLIDTWLASFLQSGSITWLYYADRMLELPLGVFGVALATVILPYLSRSTARGDATGKQELLDFGLRWAWLVSLPAMLGLMLLADDVMLCLFTYDNFTSHDARQAALALCAYIPGLPAMVLVKILATEYFSRKDTATPARIAAMAVVCNLVLNLALIKPLGHVGLALATSVAAWCNAWLLYRKLRQDGNYIPQPRWGLFFARLAAALAAMAGCVYMLQPEPQVWLHLGAVARGAGLVGIVLAGMAVFTVTAWLCGLRQKKLQ